MYEIREHIALAYSDDRLAALRYLTDHHAKIRDRSLYSLLQLLQVPARILDS